VDPPDAAVARSMKRGHNVVIRRWACAVPATATITLSERHRRVHPRGVGTFGSLLEAQVLAEDWRTEYNTYRPHSALNDLTNGLLRQYFPKRTDLAQHTDLHLAVVANELNTRPRKVLNWDTPANRFATIANTPVLQP
jgi:Integrase core domain